MSDTPPTAGETTTATSTATGATRDRAGGPESLLAINNLEVIYDEVILVLRGLSMDVATGQIVALLGSNGAGKSTTMKAITGLLPTEHGETTDGTIHLRGDDITRSDPAEIVKAGVSLVMEGRHVFEHLTVHENLVAGGFTRPAETDDGIAEVYEYFPALEERRDQSAGYLSGGEQQMLAIGRALMASPTLLMLDEPSLGLAPMLVEEIFSIIERLNHDLGTTVLLVEQNARRALDIADRGYIMENGRIVLDGSAAELADNPDVREFYLGMVEAGRKSYRDVKHYKRRKRWL